MIMIRTRPIEALGQSGLYRLLAWLSPGFPIGGFSYSHGLEAAADNGAVGDRLSLQYWIGAIITWGVGRIDADILRDAHRATSPRYRPPTGVGSRFARQPRQGSRRRHRAPRSSMHAARHGPNLSSTTGPKCSTAAPSAMPSPS